MSRQDDIIRTDRAVKDASIRLHTIGASLNAVDRELENMSTLEAQLEENIRYLKRRNIIALAQEFRKAKADLRSTQVRLAILTGQKANINRAVKEAEEQIQNLRIQLELLITGPKNNVLQGNFPRKGL